MVRRFLTATCAAAVFFAFPSHAQQVASAADDGAIIVTANRFRSSAIDQPIAVQIITADEIRDSSATTVAEVLNKLGGVHTRISFIGVPDTPLDLRGFGMTGNENTPCFNKRPAHLGERTGGTASVRHPDQRH
jgi:iron complex outermembrane receptor protein